MARLHAAQTLSRQPRAYPSSPGSRPTAMFACVTNAAEPPSNRLELDAAASADQYVLEAPPPGAAPI
jgi:hypothetical protein